MNREADKIDRRMEDLKQFLMPCIVKKDAERVVTAQGQELNWLFDFKKVLLHGETLNLVSELLWERMKPLGNFQLGGIETTAIGLVAGVVMKAKQEGAELNGFYIRKSRKKDGLQHMIEGVVGDEPIILVDDIINGGRSIIRQVELLELLGKKVHAVFTILRFREESFYRYFHEKNIRIHSFFVLDDFPGLGTVAEYTQAQAVQFPPRIEIPFSVQWKFISDNPAYFHVIPKSAPVVDDSRVYFGADNGTFWAINQSDGSVAWRYQTLFGADKKRIFSSPAVYDGTVYFGAYDGNLYALDTETGKKKWVYRDADWVGSSPCIAPDIRTLFIGLEFGLFGKRGGLAALDTSTGEKLWWQHVPSLVHSSPGYSKKHRIVVVGSSAGIIYAFRAQTGKALWQFKAGAAVRASFAFDESLNLVCFGSEDNAIYCLNTKTGALVHKIETMEPLYSNPLVENGKLYMGCLDKRVLCIDLKTGLIQWQFWTLARIFASPLMIEGHLFIGSNDGRLYELDPETGGGYGFFQATERIVNKIAYNPTTKRFFVPTFANEMYCLERKPARN